MFLNLLIAVAFFHIIMYYSSLTVEMWGLSAHDGKNLGGVGKEKKQNNSFQ